VANNPGKKQIASPNKKGSQRRSQKKHQHEFDAQNEEASVSSTFNFTAITQLAPHNMYTHIQMLKRQ
jgi:hypothetical protein